MTYTLSDYRKIVSEPFDIFDEAETKKHEEKVNRITREMLLAGNREIANMITVDSIDLMYLYVGADNKEEQRFYMKIICENLLLLEQTGFNEQRYKIISEMNDMLTKEA